MLISGLLLKNSPHYLSFLQTGHLINLTKSLLKHLLPACLLRFCFHVATDCCSLAWISSFTPNSQDTRLLLWWNFKELFRPLVSRQSCTAAFQQLAKRCFVMGSAPFSSLPRVLCIQLIHAEFCLCRYLGWGWQKELAEICQEAWEN